MKRLLILVLVLLALTVVGCGGDDEAVEQQEETITATDIAYDRERIEVTAGAPVVLTLQNDGALAHDFSIVDIPLAGEVIVGGGAEHEEEEEHEMEMDVEDLDLHVSAGPGESATVTFTPTEPGEYEYFCTVPGHLDAGMAGILDVVAP